LGAGEYPLPKAAWGLINQGADVTEKFWRILNFVKHHGRAKGFKESTRIIANSRLNVWVF